MFENLIESLLGSWGSTALEFLYQHKLIISGVVLVVWGVSRFINRHKIVEKDRIKKEKKHEEN